MEELDHSYVCEGGFYYRCAECGCEKYPTLYSQADGSSDVVLFRNWGSSALTDIEPKCLER